MLTGVKRSADSVKRYRSQMERQASTFIKRQEQRDRAAAKSKAKAKASPTSLAKQVNPVSGRPPSLTPPCWSCLAWPRSR